MPGWDCHGLPIEWKIEEEYRSKGKNKDAGRRVVEFRQECRAFAAALGRRAARGIQAARRRGRLGHPYTTMELRGRGADRARADEFAENGTLYRGSKPVMWSVVEKTALAEAEVEYEDYVSDRSG